MMGQCDTTIIFLNYWIMWQNMRDWRSKHCIHWKHLSCWIIISTWNTIYIFSSSMHPYRSNTWRIKHMSLLLRKETRSTPLHPDHQGDRIRTSWVQLFDIRPFTTIMIWARLMRILEGKSCCELLIESMTLAFVVDCCAQLRSYSARSHQNKTTTLFFCLLL